MVTCESLLTIEEEKVVHLFVLLSLTANVSLFPLLHQSAGMSQLCKRGREGRREWKWCEREREKERKREGEREREGGGGVRIKRGMGQVKAVYIHVCQLLKKLKKIP